MRTEAGRAGTALALVALALVLGLYVSRIFMALPIYAVDEVSYLIRALLSAEADARHPYAPAVNNTVYLMAIRAIALAGEAYMPWVRAFGLAAYVGGLVLVHRVATAGAPRDEGWAFLLLALAYPYYRFVVTTLPEGLFVGVLAVITVVTARLFRPRPMTHALLAGGLAAVLVLVKAHGLAVAAAMLALMALDSLWSGGWKLLPLRLTGFVLAFLSVGAAIQVLAGLPASSLVTFFIGDFYGHALGAQRPPGSEALGLLALLAMVSAVLLLAGPAALIAKLQIFGRRWSARGPARALDGRELMFFFLGLCAAATISMVAIYATKVASDPGETKRLWGRYFEFYVPLLWLAAAPFLMKAESRPNRWPLVACAATALAGLGGLLLSFRGGIVLFPWDAGALTAFFRPDPVRANLGAVVPYRALAVAASLLAVAALALGGRASRVWIGYLLALGVLSSLLDFLWLRPMVQDRERLAAEMRAAVQVVPRAPGATVLVAPDNNLGNLGFLGFGGTAAIMLAPPGPMPDEVRGARAVVMMSPDPPHPGAGWRVRYRGSLLTVFARDRTGCVSAHCH